MMIGLRKSRIRLASAEGSYGASLDIHGENNSVRIGRLLLQHAARPPAKGVNNSNSSSHGGGHKLPVVSIVVGSVAAAIAFLFLLLTAIEYFPNRWAGNVLDAQQRNHENPNFMAPSSTSYSLSLRSFMLASDEPETFSYKELESGTKSFTETLGRGGRAFKGVLTNLTDVAVKRFFADFSRTEFEQDVKQVEALQYDSLVHLFGYCSDGDHRLLVYEYHPKGSLGNYLY
ncbi:unnamed protein product [Calypogeia fissa]